MSKRIVLYYRVSTDDQTTEPQRLDDYCNRRGWPIAAEYTDTVSGAKFTRTGLERLMAAVRKRQIDVILYVKLDRLGRSFPHPAQGIFEFDSNGVALICTSQPIDTSDENRNPRWDYAVRRGWEENVHVVTDLDASFGWFGPVESRLCWPPV
jgi:DNA invertase Pin-like site-specific DNA recombinase